ncbi:MAG TPA: hypothetical protein VIC85_14035 [Ktedonobacterales bacterium]|jgi:hypothetical protein
MDATSTQPSQLIMREYTSARAFRKDARQLYARTGYTVSATTGLARRGSAMSTLAFFRRRPEHLVITYRAPTNPWPVTTDAR